MIRSLLAILWVAWCTPAAAQTMLTAEAGREDARIMREAFDRLHPGLTRYQDRAAVDSAFDILESRFDEDRSLAEAFLAVTACASSIRCGHTHVNPYNQPEVIQREILARRNKLPFTFRLLGRQMLVERDGSAGGLLDGHEILAIDGRPVGEILDALLPLVSADGSNVGQRLRRLHVTGLGEYETFDTYFGLLFPPRDSLFRVDGRRPGTDAIRTLAVEAVTREDRLRRFERRYGPLASSYDDLWQFRLLDDSTGYLKLGTFVTWKMTMNWKVFLQDSFERMRGVAHLIVDIRGNEGGDGAVLQELAAYLVRRPVRLEGMQNLLRYEKVGEDLNPHLATWDDSFRDRTGQVRPAGDGYFTWIDTAETADRLMLPSERAYGGRIYLLVDAANSSATFTLAMIMKEHRLATLIGQETGGNQRGITGGQMFFLNLPNSGIEVDIPLISYAPKTPRDDRGVVPDILVEPDHLDYALGRDPELEAAHQTIKRGVPEAP